MTKHGRTALETQMIFFVDSASEEVIKHLVCAQANWIKEDMTVGQLRSLKVDICAVLSQHLHTYDTMNKEVGPPLKEIIDASDREERT